MLEAENDKAVLEDFVKKVDSGDVIEREGPGFHNPDILFLTFEEINRDATKRGKINEVVVTNYLPREQQKILN